jgi:hypothetical protein
MNEEGPPPPPPELARLYRAETRFPQEPAARRERVHASLLVAIGSSAPAAGSAPSSTGKLGVSSVSLFFGAGGLVVGLMAGASIAWPLALSTRSDAAIPVAGETRSVEPPREEGPRIVAGGDRIVPEREGEPLASASEGSGPAPHAIEDRPPRPERALADPGRTETPVERRGGQLRAERTVLDAARAAIDDRDPVRALAALDRHDALEGPRSLDEEADALRIIALGLAGRAGEANAARERFRTRFEGSVFMPAVDRATASSR